MVAGNGGHSVPVNADNVLVAKGTEVGTDRAMYEAVRCATGKTK